MMVLVNFAARMMKRLLLVIMMMFLCMCRIKMLVSMVMLVVVMVFVVIFALTRTVNQNIHMSSEDTAFGHGFSVNRYFGYSCVINLVNKSFFVIKQFI